MSGKNLPGGLIHIKDNANGTQSYVFDKFCIFEKGYINSIYNPLGDLSTPGSTVPVFNYGITNGVLFDFIDNKGDSISVNQAPVTGNYALSFPAITSNDTLVTTNLAQTITNKRIDSANITTSTLNQPVMLNPSFAGVATGIIQNSSQYCFKAYVSSGGGNITGDLTDAQIIFNSIDFQVGTGYDTSTGVFTAPIAGLYHFTCNIQTQGWSSTNTTVQAYFTHNTQRYNMQLTSNISYANEYLVNNISTTFKMLAGDTVTVGLAVGGEPSGTKNISLVADEYNTNLIGTLLVALG